MVILIIVIRIIIVIILSRLLINFLLGKQIRLFDVVLETFLYVFFGLSILCICSYLDLFSVLHAGSEKEPFKEVPTLPLNEWYWCPHTGKYTINYGIPLRAQTWQERRLEIWQQVLYKKLRPKLTVTGHNSWIDWIKFGLTVGIVLFIDYKNRGR